MQAVTRPLQRHMAKDSAGQGRQHARDHQRPDRAGEIADQQHHHQSDDLRRQIDQHHALLLESSHSDIYLCRLEAEDDCRYAGDRQHQRQLRCGIGGTRRPQVGELGKPGSDGQQQGQGKQHKAADDLHCPGGIEEQRIVATPALDDVLA
ncbi:hypothetical protein D3C72_1511460 [compost metagenome]